MLCVEALSGSEGVQTDAGVNHREGVEIEDAEGQLARQGAPMPTTTPESPNATPGGWKFRNFSSPEEAVALIFGEKGT